MNIYAQLIDHNGLIYALDVSSIRLSSYINNKATVLHISVVAHEIYPHCSNKLVLYIDNKILFSGKIYSYTKTKYGADMVAYNSLKILQSKVTGVYKNKKLGDLIKDICHKNNLAYEYIDTQYTIPHLIFENKSYFELISDAINQTKLMTGISYILLEKDGKLTLVNPQNSIEIQVNQFMLQKELSVSKEHLFNYIHIYQMSNNHIYASYIAKDDQSINEFGKISKMIKVGQDYTPSQCKIMAKNYLKESTKENRNLTIEVPMLDIICLGDRLLIDKQKYYVCESILQINSSKCTYLLTLRN